MARPTSTKGNPDVPYLTYASVVLSHNARKIETSVLNADIVLLENLTNIQYELADTYTAVAARFVYYEHGLLPILLSAFYKNLFGFLAVLDLTRKGLYGPARPILRYMFENLVLAKYCSIGLDSALMQRWDDKQQINLTNDVFNKIRDPATPALRTFWKDLHQFVHATRTAQQISLNVDENWQDIRLNVIFVRILLECNYHVLNRCILNPSVAYYVEHYGKQRYERARMLKRELREKFSFSKKSLSNDSKAVIGEFVRQWSVRT